MGLFWKLQPKFWLAGSISQINLYAGCATLLGGGTLFSLVAVESSTGKVSSTAEAGFRKFKGWFSSTTKNNKTVVTRSGESILDNFGKIFSFSEKSFKEVKSFIEKNWSLLKGEEKKFFELIKSKDLQNASDAKWKEFFNGLWALMGLMYRDEVTAERWTLWYLLSSVFVDREEWASKKNIKEAFINAYGKLNTRIKLGIEQFLLFLHQLNKEAKSKRDRGNKGSPINIKLRDIDISVKSWKWVEGNSNSKPQQ